VPSYNINLEGVGISLARKWRAPPSIYPALHPRYSDYTNLKYLGTVPSGCNLKAKLPYERSLNPYSTKLGPDLKNITDIAGDAYYLSVPNIENVEFSISTFEKKPPVNYSDAFHEFGLDFLQNQYSGICVDPISNSEEIFSSIDLSRSTGWPWNLFGYENKRELSMDPEFQRFISTNQHLSYRPIWCVHPKEEFKTLEDLKALKIRLFTIPPMELLYEQLRFGKRISERLKTFKWSAYGFNPYSGGTNRLASLLLMKRIRLFYDVSGWDKFIPLINDVMTFVYTNSNIPLDLEDNFRWMAYNTVNYLFKTPFGHVFEKKYGNPSGSGTTTRDNIFAHIIIIAAALAECYHKKYGCMPTIQAVAEQVVRVFGDDSILAVDERFERILDEGYLHSHFAKYGLKLKFLYGGLDFPIEQMQFLGFTFCNIDGNYYPKYDIQKLCTSAIYRNGRNDSREAYTSRLFIIMLMSFPHVDKFHILKRAFITWCDYLSKQDDLTPTEMSYLNMSTISDHMIKQMFLGWESGSGKSFDFLFYHTNFMTNVSTEAFSWWMEAIKENVESFTC